MEKNYREQKSYFLDLFPDEILILPSLILVIDTIISGEIFDFLTIIFLFPLVLLLLTYLQRRKLSSVANFKLYGIRQVIFALFFLLMFLGGIGMAMQLAEGEKLLVEHSYLINILIVIGYFLTAILFYRYGQYVKILRQVNG